MRSMPRPRLPRLALLLLVALVLGLVAVACGGDDDVASGAAAAEVDFSAEEIGRDFTPEFQVRVMNSALGIGPTRLTIGLSNAAALIQGAEGTLRVYRVDDGDTGKLVGEHVLHSASIASETEHEHADGSAHLHEDPVATVYYANVDFDASGEWGVVLSVTIDGEARDAVRAAFVVQDRTPEPHIGDPLPASTNLTLRDVDDISTVSSALEPIAALSELTVAEALATGKPVLVAISTPAFCVSRICGPVLEQVVYPLYEEFGDNVQFVHVEPFLLDEARANGRLVAVPLLAEWNLRSEPWIFLADRDGLVAAKFEGIASIEEVRETLLRLVAATPRSSGRDISATGEAVALHSGPITPPAHTGGLLTASEAVDGTRGGQLNVGP
jgi:hypothetical protein